MSNKNEIDELCYNLEKCNSLEHIRMYVSIETTMVFSNIFDSLAKLQRLNKINLYFNSLKEMLPRSVFGKVRADKKSTNVKYLY
jgi:hypothetical protein